MTFRTTVPQQREERRSRSEISGRRRQHTLLVRTLRCAHAGCTLPPPLLCAAYAADVRSVSTCAADQQREGECSSSRRRHQQQKTAKQQKKQRGKKQSNESTGCRQPSC